MRWEQRSASLLEAQRTVSLVFFSCTAWVDFPFLIHMCIRGSVLYLFCFFRKHVFLHVYVFYASFLCRSIPRVPHEVEGLLGARRGHDRKFVLKVRFQRFVWLIRFCFCSFCVLPADLLTRRFGSTTHGFVVDFQFLDILTIGIGDVHLQACPSN